MHSLKVLILEDSPFQLMALHQMLNASGVFDVLTAESVEAACRSLERRGAVDVAICDLQMEGADGLDMIRHLASTGQAKALIILSSVERNVLDNVAQLARHLGLRVLAALQKPASPATLHRLLESYRQRDVQAERLPPLLEVHELVPLSELTEQELPQLKAQWQAYYQPKVAMDGQLLGVEALVRWHHPQRGVLSPASFLPLVSYAGLMEPLTWHMLDTALQFSAHTRDASGRHLSVSVNIPPAMLEHRTFAPQLVALLKQHRLPARVLTLEVVENRETTASEEQVEALLRLRMIGCRLSLDDYGVGDSNIQRLLELPFSEIKIPSQFVRGMAEDGRKAAVVAGALIMARRMSLDVVVEGIETASDYQALGTLGAPALQGYYVARPMPRAALEQWLANAQAHVWNAAEDCPA
ncbi:MAG: EAL domain-containing response regulator [Pseudomonas sp.]|uniref:EAL domain-containing response regulator n=1 Tax=Pseudomonas abieticivorans TaxID=2931382 RepID=UPI0020BE99C2|nr:EAL domain-containing response regulator [Pseudomonas sp. PIA16]MDE1166057.1 EAL domain-containing response regulator [Pseudomonas sp.]